MLCYFKWKVICRIYAWLINGGLRNQPWRQKGTWLLVEVWKQGWQAWSHRIFNSFIELSFTGHAMHLFKVVRVECLYYSYHLRLSNWRVKVLKKHLVGQACATGPLLAGISAGEGTGWLGMGEWNIQRQLHGFTLAKSKVGNMRQWLFAVMCW